VGISISRRRNRSAAVICPQSGSSVTRMTNVPWRVLTRYALAFNSSAADSFLVMTAARCLSSGLAYSAASFSAIRLIRKVAPIGARQQVQHGFHTSSWTGRAIPDSCQNLSAYRGYREKARTRSGREESRGDNSASPREIRAVLESLRFEL